MHTHKMLKPANKCTDMETHNQKPTRDNTALFNPAIYIYLNSNKLYTQVNSGFTLNHWASEIPDTINSQFLTVIYSKTRNLWTEAVLCNL